MAGQPQDASLVRRWRASVAAATRPPADPALLAEQRRTVMVRFRAGALVALAIIPLCILTFVGITGIAPMNLAFALSAAADASIAILLLAARTRWLQEHHQLAFFLLVGPICCGTEAVMVQITGGAGSSPFIFPYALILFGIATLYPANFSWAVGAALMSPLSFVAAELVVRQHLGGGATISNLLAISNTALIAVIGNRVTTRVYFREVEGRLALEEANTRLRELDRAKSEFFASLSHDLRTPLNVIIGPVQTVAARAQSLEPRYRRYLELAVRSARRLDMMINDLLELARIEAGVSGLRLTRVNVLALVASLVETHVPYAASLGMKLELTEPPEAFDAEIDPDKLERVVMNLVSNALKFSGAGTTVRVRLQVQPGGFEVTVQDQGPGIAREDLDRIFARFVRGRGESDRRVRGAGIGLAVVREFVELHRGRVSVESELGKGSTFHAFFPSAILPATVEPAQTGEETASSGRRDALSPLLLLAEDDDEARVFLATELGQSVQVIAASNGEQALRLAAENPDVVLLDVSLPGVDGIEVCRRLRRLPHMAKVPILVFSARGDLHTRLSAFEAGADDFVHKPIEPLELKARIDSLLRRSTGWAEAPRPPEGAPDHGPLPH